MVFISDSSRLKWFASGDSDAAVISQHDHHIEQHQDQPLRIPMLIIPLQLNERRFTHRIDLFLRKLQKRSANHTSKTIQTETKSSDIHCDV